MFKCPKCNAEFAENKNFCEFCGAQLEAVEAEPVVEAPVAPAQPVVDPILAVDDFTAEEAPAKKAFPIKKLLGIAIPVAAIVIVAAILLSIFAPKKLPNYIFYQKDDELFFTKAAKISPLEISEKIDGDGAGDIQVSNDGKYIFFIGNNGDSELFYIKANDKKAEPKKLDSKVYNYKISEDGKAVYYKKDGDLYKHDLKDKSKVASDVNSYYISANGSKVYYTTIEEGEENNSYDLYLKNGKKDAKKLAGNVDRVQFNKKFDTVYYMVDEVLYKQEGTKDNQKISDDVAYIVKLYDSGEFYFVTRVTEEKEEDGYTYEETTEALNFYDGKNVKKIVDDLADYHDYAVDAPVIIYSVYEGEDDNREIKYYAAVEDSVNNIETNKEENYNFAVTDDGKTIYYISAATEDNEDNVGDLYSIAVNGKKIKAAESYDKDVYAGRLSIDNEKQVVYYKDYKDEKGVLYIDKKKVADDVSQAYYFEFGKEFIYLSDADEGKFTINIYKSGKSKKVSEDVSDLGALPNGDLLYLKDFDAEKGKGTLYIYNGSKSKQIDEDVQAIVSFDCYTDDQYYK